VASSFHPLYPFFGRLLTGPPAAAIFLAFAVLEAALAWGLYRLRPAAWWARLGLWLVNGSSSAITFYRGVDWQQVLQASGQPDNPMARQMLDVMFQGPYFLILIAIVAVAFLGYLLCVRRYFVRPASG
jgi:hypothetical protein